MRFGKWLNSLTGIDHLVIIFCFLVASGITHYLLKYLEQIYNHLQRDNKYANKFRVTPILFFLVAFPIATAIYLVIGAPIASIFNQ